MSFILCLILNPETTGEGEPWSATGSSLLPPGGAGRMAEFLTLCGCSLLWLGCFDTFYFPRQNRKPLQERTLATIPKIDFSEHFLSEIPLFLVKKPFA